MIDWTWEIVKLLLGVLFSFVSFVAGMWYFNKYMLPKMVSNMGSSFLKQAMDDDNFKPWIKRFQTLIEEIEPLVKKVKDTDFDKITQDLSPFIEALKKVNPEDVDQLLKALRDLTGAVKKAIDKPPPPPPPD